MLARRAAGDDLAAFAALVRAHEAGLRRYLARLAGDEGDDLSQETLLAAWRAIGQWRGEGRFAGWLRRIATRRFLDRQRRGGNTVPRSWASLDGAEATAAPGSPHLALEIEAALGRLPPRERAAALLVFAEGHSHAEAAEALGVPLGTLKSIVARARATLIPLLEGDAP